ncbi:hypothetical protein ASD04_07775 [Devosia sp. Root436]|jgi:hypothetical protein|uniref:hypothetical protein n=1 Tax=Devosia sp. Root436 TaxID=1736537 RepID=UPI0006F216B2|nr:hypothetical protein [Devosia sp. Root436]KQX38558.1 hypothetical protein ASD04_07775 [Devosia sp. Root436]
MTSLPDRRYETARDHLLQALAIMPAEGSEVIRLLVEEAARRCDARAYRDVPDLLPLPPDSHIRPD